ncbi:MAG: xanthine dehydrogenase family protein molybdopterin-binding subunit [Phycisphaerae bacterium]
MTTRAELSRREVLKSAALAGGGLVLGFHLGPATRAVAAQPDAAPFEPNAFIRIGLDDTITVLANHSEMGQGTYTSLPMLVAEELDADWTKVRVEAAPVANAYRHTAFGMQMVGGSSSTWSEWQRLRSAGATARAMLVQAAAEEWKVDPAACKTENGHVIHAETSRRMPYGRLAAAAAKLTPPKDVALKDPKDFKIIGKPIKRLDTPEKINGAGIFGIDVNLPGMLVAVVARAPVFGGKLKRFDAGKAQAISGVRHVVEIERGVAVVADGYWQAQKGRAALDVEWDDGAMAGYNTPAQRAEYAALAAKPGAVARNDGDVEAAIEKAARKLEAIYELPFLAHATMEPMNCVADVRPDGCEVWVGSQLQTVDHAAAAEIAELPLDKVKLHTTLLGGGFGRRAVADSHFVREAVQISKAIKKPVKVIWSREDDTQGGYYRPAALHSLRGALDDAGNPVAWSQHIVCQSFIVGSPFEAMMVRNGVDQVAVEGALELVYDIPNIRVAWSRAASEIPTLWWRSVGHSHTAFAIESFIDEMARAAGKDPLAYRCERMGKTPRLLRVLELAAEKAGWGGSLPAGRGRGIAAHESFGSFVSHVAEVSVAPNGSLKVDRVVCAIDCGPVVNPDTVRAQMESCVAFALSAALHGELTFDKGRVQQRNFHDYPILRMNEMPLVEVHIVPSTEKMGGVGEPGVPPLAPAVANAIHAATGKRVRRLPIRAEDLKHT